VHGSVLSELGLEMSQRQRRLVGLLGLSRHQIFSSRPGLRNVRVSANGIALSRVKDVDGRTAPTVRLDGRGANVPEHSISKVCLRRGSVYGGQATLVWAYFSPSCRIIPMAS
jgi:hypothetical protein